MSLLKITNCLVSKKLDEANLLNEKPGNQKSGVDIVTNQFLNEMVNDYKNLCSLFIAVEKATGPVFEKVKKERKLPDELYVFSIFTMGGDNKGNETVFTKQEVGLFDSLKSCEEIESFAHARNIPVQQCHKWQDIMKLIKKPVS